MLVDNNIQKVKLVEVERGSNYRNQETSYYLYYNVSNMGLPEGANNISITDITLNIRDFQNQEIERLLDINAKLYRERDELEEKNKKLTLELLNYQEMTRLEKFVSALCM